SACCIPERTGSTTNNTYIAETARLGLSSIGQNTRVAHMKRLSYLQHHLSLLSLANTLSGSFFLPVSPVHFGGRRGGEKKSDRRKNLGCFAGPFCLLPVIVLATDCAQWSVEVCKLRSGHRW
ncbi:hypothetical protein T310_8755, partial [Rasamsonia emersonii CBS 393.64]